MELPIFIKHTVGQLIATKSMEVLSLFTKFVNLVYLKSKCFYMVSTSLASSSPDKPRLRAASSIRRPNQEFASCSTSSASE